MTDNKVLDQVFLPAFVGKCLLSNFDNMKPTVKMFRESLGVFTSETFFMPILINRIKIQVFLFHRDLKSVSTNNPREAYDLSDVLKTFYNKINETMSVKNLNTEIKDTVEFLDQNKKGFITDITRIDLLHREPTFFSPFFLVGESDQLSPIQIDVETFEVNEMQSYPYPEEWIPNFLV